MIADDPTQPIENRLTNVGELRTRGVEFEARTSPFQGMQLNGYLTYIDAEIKEFPFGRCYAGQTGSRVVSIRMVPADATRFRIWQGRASMAY